MQKFGGVFENEFLDCWWKDSAPIYELKYQF